MSKAFTRESDSEEPLDDADSAAEIPLASGEKNYLTPAGYARLFNEAKHLLETERPAVVQTVSWAASNGDRSENGDYIYGKRRLREIDRRLRFLTKRLEVAEVVDTQPHQHSDQIFFGATVTYENLQGERQTITIVGIDEAEPLQNRISWRSPVARALIKSRVGDIVQLETPGGHDELEVLSVSYDELHTLEKDGG